MMNQSVHQQFNDLHQHHKPLVLINVWDPASAVMVAKMGARAIATSSASLCWAMGYSDGNLMPFSELKSMVKRIQAVNTLPLTVDLEGGYSDDPKMVANQVVQLIDLGVVGINIEDGQGDVDLLVEKIAAIRTQLNGRPLFINARTDVYLQQWVAENERQAASLERAKKYMAAGADGLFIPGLRSLNEIKSIAAEVTVPLNVMVDQWPIDVKAWSAVWVARISTGPAPFLSCYEQLKYWCFSAEGCHDNNNHLQYPDVNQLFTAD